MAERYQASARQAHEQKDQQNKYARVIQEALAEKRTRQDLGDDRRIMQRAPAPTWQGAPET